MWQRAQAERPADLGPVGRIASPDEPGVPLVVKGRVFAPDGTTPAAGVIVFAYQTGRDGLYFDTSRPQRIWRLHGWAETDADGRFELHTIRPGPYPGRHEPAHIHFSFESATWGRQWAPSLRFADDPLLSEREKAESATGRFGNVRRVHMEHGVAQVSFFVKLKPRPDF